MTNKEKDEEIAKGTILALQIKGYEDACKDSNMSVRDYYFTFPSFLRIITDNQIKWKS